MKSLIYVLVSIFVSININSAEIKMTREIQDNFTDKIKEVKVVDGGLEISFSRHAAIYHVKNDHPNFKELQNFINTNANNKKAVKVTSTIPKMIITDIKE